MFLFVLNESQAGQTIAVSRQEGLQGLSSCIALLDRHDHHRDSRLRDKRGQDLPMAERSGNDEIDQPPLQLTARTATIHTMELA